MFIVPDFQVVVPINDNLKKKKLRYTAPISGHCLFMTVWNRFCPFFPNGYARQLKSFISGN